jgi:hypothetical protein
MIGSITVDVKVIVLVMPARDIATISAGVGALLTTAFPV